MRRAVTHSTQLFQFFIQITSELTRASLTGKMALRKITTTRNLQTWNIAVPWFACSRSLRLFVRICTLLYGMPALPWDVCALVLGCMRAPWDVCAALGCMLYLSLFLANAEKSDLIVPVPLPRQCWNIAVPQFACSRTLRLFVRICTLLYGMPALSWDVCTLVLGCVCPCFGMHAVPVPLPRQCFISWSIHCMLIVYWWREWFGPSYHALCPNRDHNEDWSWMSPNPWEACQCLAVVPRYSPLVELLLG